MTDLYLKFTDQAQSIDVLYAKKNEVITTEEGEEIILVPDLSKPLYRNIDIIGTIYEETGEVEVDSGGIETPVMEAIEGFHVNVRVLSDEDSTPLEPFVVQPSTPMRVWA